MIWLGDKGHNIFATWNLSEEDRQIYEKFEEYVKLHTNVTRFQSDKELFDQFVTELKLFVRNCNYDRSEEMVRDWIVIGVNNTIYVKNSQTLGLI